MASEMMSYSGSILVTIIGLSMGLAMSFGAWHLVIRANTLSPIMRLFLGIMAFAVLFSGFAISGYLFKTTLFEPMNVEPGRRMFLYLWSAPVVVTILLALRRGLKGDRAGDAK